jgi:DNA-binding NarL/FixJ family response regulator
MTSSDQSPVIVIIDDNQDALEIARLAAHKVAAPLTVLTMRDGLEGLQQIQCHAGRVRVVVLDVRMPRIDGRWLFAEIRRIAPAARIIPYTADCEAAQQLVELGSCPPLYKPMIPGAIVSALEQALSARPLPVPSTRLYTFLQEQAPWVVQHAGAESTTLRVALLARSAALRTGLAAVLARSGAELCLATGQPEELRAMARSRNMRLIVCTPDLLEAAQVIARATQVPLLLYMFQDAGTNLVLAPQTNLVVEPISAADLADALRTIAAGGQYRRPVEALTRLSARQRLLVDLVAANYPVAAIASALEITPGRVYHMLTELYKQLGMDGIAALRAWAHSHLAAFDQRVSG